ncbi:MAG: MMPL family transporter [Actinomycetota bacterium]
MTTPVRSQTRLGRLAHFCYTRRRRVLLLWLVGLIGITVVSQVAGNKFANKFGSGNSESARAQRLLAGRFPAAAGDQAQVVFHTTDPISSPANAAAIQSLVTSLQGLPHISGVISPLSEAGQAQLSRDGHIAFALVQFDQLSSDIPIADVKKVIATAEAARHPGFEVELGGAPIDNVVFSVPGASEGIGIGAAIIILLFAFGSVVAMGLPVLVALFGIGIGFAFQDLLSHIINTPTFGPSLTAMIGIGVGIDYALFIVTRYKEGLHQGMEPGEAVELALTTAGRAVLFAGTTVVISLLGLLLMGQPFVVGLALGAIAAVLLVMLGTVTLLPALLGYSGRAIDRLRLPKFLRRDLPPGRHTLAYRWSREIQRRPVIAALASLIILVALAIPLFSMRLAFTDDGNAPTTLTTRKSYDLLAQGFGPGSNGPLIIAVDMAQGADPAVATRLAGALASDPDVAFVAPPRFNRPQGGDAAVLIVIPKSSPQDPSTQTLVQHLRKDVIPAATQGTGVRALVGGFTAGGIDSSDQLSTRLPLVIALVVGLSFLLLMAVFRSVAVPVKAAVMNLLSIGAAYGVIVAVFQWGWLGGVIGIGKTGPIDPWVPLFLFTILFGLSMDYEVFLLSRIREEWLATGDNATSVADGLAATARVITAAAAIMICVFGSFIINDPLRVLKLFGLGLATAVLVDATLVRMVLVPATMELLGGANWWLPRWLDHILPKVNVEGTHEVIEPQSEPAAT